MIRSVLFAIVAVTDTIIFSLLAIFFGIFRPYSKLNSWIMRTWARVLLLAAGVKLQVDGVKNIGQNQSYIITANHQSHIDIPVALAALPLSIRIISKKELFKIPIFGWGMRAAGIIEIDRSNRRRAIETLKQAEQIVQKHHLSILAFPEGTRSNDGKIHAFKKGPFVLAINSGIPVLPVSISGTRNILPKGKLRVRKGRVTVKINESISTKDRSLENRNKIVEETFTTVVKGFEENYA